MLSFPGNRQTTKNGKFPPTEKKMNISGKHTKRITTIVEYRGRRRRSKKKISKLGQINWFESCTGQRKACGYRLPSPPHHLPAGWSLFLLRPSSSQQQPSILFLSFFPMFPSSTTIPSSYRQRTPISTQRETHTSANGDEFSVCVWAYAGEIGAMPGLL